MGSSMTIHGEGFSLIEGGGAMRKPLLPGSEFYWHSAIILIMEVFR